MPNVVDVILALEAEVRAEHKIVKLAWKITSALNQEQMDDAIEELNEAFLGYKRPVIARLTEQE